MTNIKSLRHHPIVEAWITTYQNNKAFKEFKDEDCSNCGFPHEKSLLCGGTTTFGELCIGRHTYYINASNVEYFIKFREQPSVENAIHWHDDIYFQRTEKEEIKISYYVPFNNTPQKQVWVIPAMEWESIVNFLKVTTPF